MHSPTWRQSAGAELPDHGVTPQSVTGRSPSASGRTCVGAPTAAACPEGLGALTVLSLGVQMGWGELHPALSWSPPALSL